MTYHFYYEGQSTAEIRDGSDLVLKQHVWANLAGGYVDELIENDVNADPADGSEQDCELRGWACQDANYNVIGFVDDDLAVLERYEYTPYGERTVFYSAGSNDPLAHTPTLIPRRVELSGTSGGQAYGAYAIGHQGLYHDEETGETLIYNRRRMLHTRLGRFTQRDPIDYLGGNSNLYGYVNSQPLMQTDSSGLCPYGQCLKSIGDPDDSESSCCSGWSYNPSKYCCNNGKLAPGHMKMDDFNRRCMSCEMQDVYIRREPSEDQVRPYGGHEWIEYPAPGTGLPKSRGLYPKKFGFPNMIIPTPGEIQNDIGRRYGDDQSSKYLACPESIQAIDNLVMGDEFSPPYWSGWHNCQTWAYGIRCSAVHPPYQLGEAW